MKHLYRTLFPAIAVVMALNLSSCRVAARVILGVDTSPSWKTPKKLKRDFNRLDIPEDQRFVADTSGYTNAVFDDYFNQLDELKEQDPVDSSAIKELKMVSKDNAQPVQVRYFDKTGVPLFKLVNCYVDPPIPMNWNVGGCFDVFPPAAPDSLLTKGNKELNYFLPFIKTINGKEVVFNDLPEADYYVLVFWNYFMKRPSKKLMKQLRSYHNEHSDKSTFFLFVNNQNSVIWKYVDEKDKPKLIEKIRKKEEKREPRG